MPSRQQQKANKRLTQNIKEHYSQEIKSFIFQSSVDHRKMNSIWSVRIFTRQGFTKVFYSLKHILVGK